MGLGSQRAALRDPGLAETYAVARAQAPTAPLFANVGAAQLVAQGDASALSIDEVGRLVEMIRADALIVHLNALQELIQPEGDRNARGWLAAIARLAADLPVPVIAKEVGGGISTEVAVRLVAAGVAAIDVGGRGGTSFASIEGRRAAERGDARGVALAGALRHMGHPDGGQHRLRRPRRRARHRHRRHPLRPRRRGRHRPGGDGGGGRATAARGRRGRSRTRSTRGSRPFGMACWRPSS